MNIKIKYLKFKILMKFKCFSILQSTRFCSNIGIRFLSTFLSHHHMSKNFVITCILHILDLWVTWDLFYLINNLRGIYFMLLWIFTIYFFSTFTYNLIKQNVQISFSFATYFSSQDTHACILIIYCIIWYSLMIWNGDLCFIPMLKIGWCKKTCPCFLF